MTSQCSFYDEEQTLVPGLFLQPSAFFLLLGDFQQNPSLHTNDSRAMSKS